jgi:hypothetical protein
MQLPTNPESQKLAFSNPFHINGSNDELNELLLGFRTDWEKYYLKFMIEATAGSDQYAVELFNQLLNVLKKAAEILVSKGYDNKSELAKEIAKHIEQKMAELIDATPTEEVRNQLKKIIKDNFASDSLSQEIILTAFEPIITKKFGSNVLLQKKEGQIEPPYQKRSLETNKAVTETLRPKVEHLVAKNQEPMQEEEKEEPKKNEEPAMINEKPKEDTIIFEEQAVSGKRERDKSSSQEQTKPASNDGRSDETIVTRPKSNSKTEALSIKGTSKKTYLVLAAGTALAATGAVYMMNDSGEKPVVNANNHMTLNDSFNADTERTENPLPGSTVKEASFDGMRFGVDNESEAYKKYVAIFRRSQMSRFIAALNEATVSSEVDTKAGDTPDSLRIRLYENILQSGVQGNKGFIKSFYEIRYKNLKKELKKYEEEGVTPTSDKLFQSETKKEDRILFDALGTLQELPDRSKIAGYAVEMDTEKNSALAKFEENYKSVPVFREAVLGGIRLTHEKPCPRRDVTKCTYDRIGEYADQVISQKYPKNGVRQLLNQFWSIDQKTGNNSDIGKATSRSTVVYAPSNKLVRSSQ